MELAVGTFGAEQIVLDLIKGKRILDVGCGKGKYGYLVKMYLESFHSILPEVIGIDTSREALMYAKKIYDHLICCDARKLPFRDKVFDALIAAEVIEHLPRKDGLFLIKECERVTKRIIVTTPSPRTVRGSLEHVSCWKPRDLKKLGYKVYGVRRYPRLASNNLLVQLLVAFLFYPLSLWFPTLGSFIIACKDC